MKIQTYKIKIVLILFISTIFSTYTSAAIGDCVDGLYNVYDHACDKAERDSMQCTDRIEQTPRAEWCCCNNDYPLSGCTNLFDNIFAGVTNSSSSKMMVQAQNFRTNVLAKNELGKKYIDIYYKNVNNMTKLLKKNPKLAKQTAKVLNENKVMMTTLSNGKPYKVETAQMAQILKLLKAYADAAGEKSGLSKLSYNLSSHLMDQKWLNKLGITIIGDYYEGNTFTSDKDKDKDKDDDKDDDDDKDNDPNTCDKPKSGMCDNVKMKNGTCPKGCNKVNATECSCIYKGPEGGKSPEIKSGDDEWGDWACEHLGVCW